MLEGFEKGSYTWLITGVAGFIGSNLLESLLRMDQHVIGLDNFSTGRRNNLDDVQRAVTEIQWNRFRFSEGDVCDLEICRSVLSGGVDFVLHQAALGSVPRSIRDPIASNLANVTGFLNMLVASRDAGVRTFVYAASSSTYGDHTGLPKVEDVIGKPLSPYAVTKYVNELYADVFYRVYGFRSIGLRYFNVFGPRQDPNGPYAAVIPRWIDQIRARERVKINGDGETSRDFCFVENVVHANLRAALADENAKGEVYNIAVGERTTLNQVFCMLSEIIGGSVPDPEYLEFREGDVRHSLADISKATRCLGYHPLVRCQEGLQRTVKYFDVVGRNRLSDK